MHEDDINLRGMGYAVFEVNSEQAEGRSIISGAGDMHRWSVHCLEGGKKQHNQSCNR